MALLTARYYVYSTYGCLVIRCRLGEYKELLFVSNSTATRILGSDILKSIDLECESGVLCWGDR